MDKLQWFKFYPSEWMMGKISRLPMHTQGEWVRLCCIYWNKNCSISRQDAKFELSEESYKLLHNANILKISDDGFIQIEFLDQQFEKISETSIKNSNAGKLSGIARRNKKGTTVERPLNDRLTTVERNTNESEQIKIKNKKDIYREFDHLSITLSDYQKLCSIWETEEVIQVIDSIENYKNNTKYKSLYLTARSWLKDKPKIGQISSSDNLVSNVMSKIND